MRSRTSFFNKKIFLKNTARFWPIWLSYVLMWLFIMPVTTGSNLMWSTRAPLNYAISTVECAVTGGAIMSALWGVFTAMALWSYLYSSRSAGFMASLPIKRDELYMTNIISGLLWLIGANVLVAAVQSAVLLAWGMGEIVYCAWMWCAIVSLECIFFFGLASFCAMLTGHLVVLPVVYAVLNFTVVVVETCVRQIMGLFVYGLDVSSSLILYVFSPATAMVQWDVTAIDRVTGERFRYVYDADSAWNGYIAFDGWLLAAIYAAVGIALIAGGLAIYHRRRMESASDIVAVKALRPVFRYCMALGGAITLGLVFYQLMFSGMRGTAAAVMTGVCMLAGSFICWCIAEMLMKKSFRIFRGFKSFIPAAAVIALFVVSCETDLFGYEKYIPDADEITHVWLRGVDYSEFAEKENIEAVREIHAAIIENKRLYEEYSPRGERVWTGTVSFEYTLESGRIVEREYYVWEDLVDYRQSDGPAAKMVRLSNTVEGILSRSKIDEPLTANDIISGYVNGDVKVDGETSRWEYALTSSEAKMLYSAIYEDMCAGRIGKVAPYTDDTYYEYQLSCYIEIEVQRLESDDIRYHDYIGITPTTESVSTLAALRSLGIEPASYSELEIEQFKDLEFYDKYGYWPDGTSAAVYAAG